eukprot:474067-Rhodomonas_salina.2
MTALCTSGQACSAALMRRLTPACAAVHVALRLLKGPLVRTYTLKSSAIQLTSHIAHRNRPTCAPMPMCSRTAKRDSFLRFSIATTTTRRLVTRMTRKTAAMYTPYPPRVRARSTKIMERWVTVAPVMVMQAAAKCNSLPTSAYPSTTSIPVYVMKANTRIDHDFKTILITVAHTNSTPTPKPYPTMASAGCWMMPMETVFRVPPPPLACRKPTPLQSCPSGMSPRSGRVHLAASSASLSSHLHTLVASPPLYRFSFSPMLHLP